MSRSAVWLLGVVMLACGCSSAATTRLNDPQAVSGHTACRSGDCNAGKPACPDRPPRRPDRLPDLPAGPCQGETTRCGNGRPARGENTSPYAPVPSPKVLSSELGSVGPDQVLELPAIAIRTACNSSPAPPAPLLVPNRERAPVRADGKPPTTSTGRGPASVAGTRFATDWLPGSPALLAKSLPPEDDGVPFACTPPLIVGAATAIPAVPAPAMCPPPGAATTPPSAPANTAGELPLAPPLVVRAPPEVHLGGAFTTPSSRARTAKQFPKVRRP